ncbi:MAG TPA: CCA tRNA nucleotidyltransferase, partial [Rhabdaerophilum sp.]|nr:CCA tRNA nucleotidyltransferase [Rhabdaerophilum sp.]
MPAVQDILALLAGPGEETRIVGGALRNALLGLDAKDIDFVTTHLPDEVMRIGRESGWHAVPTGIDHGTVSLVREGQAFEVTTLREDIETDGRRATVRFGRDFEHDAARRDFTINALSMGRDGILHDYFGGAADLAARRVRFIGLPQQRLREDYLRGLRFLRFSAWYGEGRLDAEGFAAVKALRAGFARLSRERVRQEMLLLLKAPQVLPVLAAAEKA